MILLFITFIYAALKVHPHCHGHFGCTYRIPLGLTPLPVVVTNKKIGTHALTVGRQTITHELGYNLIMEKLNIQKLDKQTFEVRVGGKDGIVLDYEDKKHLKSLTLYTRYGSLYVGSPRETVGGMPIYLKKVPGSIPRHDIVIFRMIAGNKCLGLKPVSKINDSNQIYVPVFNECVDGAEDQLWAVFLMKLVKDRMDYDRHLISRRHFEDRQHFFQAHEWPTLRILLDKLHTIGMEHLITRHIR